MVMSMGSGVSVSSQRPTGPTLAPMDMTPGLLATGETRIASRPRLRHGRDQERRLSVPDGRSRRQALCPVMSTLVGSIAVREDGNCWHNHEEYR
jgi:hypothetical protein